MGNNGVTIKDIPIVLASGSPRRIKLLQDMGLNPYILTPDCAEDIGTELTPSQTVMALALRKNLRAQEMLAENQPFDDYIVITCDTVVSLEGHILGKPKDAAEAYRMLSALNGKMNSVYSGVCLQRRSSGRLFLFYDKSDVYFYQYGIQDIVAYIGTGEPMDKAGGYAIQGGFGQYCEKVVGSMNNVIGLPTEMIVRMIEKDF